MNRLEKLLKMQQEETTDYADLLEQICDIFVVQSPREYGDCHPVYGPDAKLKISFRCNKQRSGHRTVYSPDSAVFSWWHEGPSNLWGDIYVQFGTIRATAWQQAHSNKGGYVSLPPARALHRWLTQAIFQLEDRAEIRQVVKQFLGKKATFADLKAAVK